MRYCSVCHREIKIINAQIIKLKKRRKTHKRYVHDYCSWRMHKFWKYDFGSVLAFFIFNFIAFILILLAGTVGDDLILRNMSFIDLGWTFISSISLFLLNYLRALRECDDYYRSAKKVKRRPYLAYDEVVKPDDLVA